MFLTVALGAFAKHGLSDRLDAHHLEIFETGVKYMGIHGLGLLALASLERFFTSKKLITITWLFVAGMILFTGSLFALALSGQNWFGAITPLGGLCFLVGWFFFATGASTAQ